MVRDGGCRLSPHVFVVDGEVGGSCGRVTRSHNHKGVGVLQRLCDSNMQGLSSLRYAAPNASTFRNYILLNVQTG
jgi:hypothetical protein